MKPSNFAWIILVIVGMSGGQLLFKLASRSFANSESAIRGFLSPYLFFGVLLYAIVTLIWVWQLSMIDLSRAYPFMALSFVFVPLLSTLALGEATSARYWLGIALIILGIFVVQSDV